MMVETSEAKVTNLEAALDKARGLHSLRQFRERLVLELGNLQFNVIQLQMAGKTLFGERQRIEGEIAKVREKEQRVLQEVREFFTGLVKDVVQPVQENMPALLAERLRLRDLLAEAGNVYVAVESAEKKWKAEVGKLRKVATELRAETKESYPLPEPPFPATLVPAPRLQQIVRAREHGDNTGEILQSLAKQIS